MAARVSHLRPLPDPEVRTAEELTPVVGSGGQEKLLQFSWETLDRYKLVSPLAKGGMAEVFLAAQEVGSFAHRPVVIKRLYAHLAADPVLVQMFLDEAKLLCLLEHPHVVRTYEAGIIDGQCCIAMEYLEGQTLARVMKRAHERSLLTPALAIEIADSILSGLHYTHEARDEEGKSLAIVHRDVSPQNVFITNDGAVKILDFGVAKAATQENRTRTGIVKGKPGYIAPEQAKAEPVDRRADVWSAGVILWEALTGKRLFRADTEAAAAMLSLTARIDPPSAGRPDIPRGVDSIVLRALERSVEKRYQTAFDMRMDLQGISPWSSKDTNALAKLMQTLFAEEVAEQRRLVSMLMARSDCTPPSGRAPVVPEKARTPVTRPATEKPRPPVPPPSSVRSPAPPTRKVPVFAVAFAGSFALVLGAWALLSANGHESKPVVAEVPPVVATPAPQPVVATPVPQPVVAEAPTAAAPTPVPVAPLPLVPRPMLQRRPAPTPSAASASMATQVVEPVVEAFGSLTFDTTPWSLVSEGGRSLGQTPLIRVKLSAGTHTLTLKNSELGIETTYTVNIEPGKTLSRRIGLE